METSGVNAAAGLFVENIIIGRMLVWLSCIVAAAGFCPVTENVLAVFLRGRKLLWKDAVGKDGAVVPLEGMLAER